MPRTDAAAGRTGDLPPGPWSPGELAAQADLVVGAHDPAAPVPHSQQRGQVPVSRDSGVRTRDDRV